MRVRHQLVIGLDEVHVLVLTADIVLRVRLEDVVAALIVGRRDRDRSAAADDDGIRQIVALHVIVDEEEVLVVLDRTAGGKAVLIEVIGTLRAIVDLVDVVVRVVALVAQEVEERAVEIVRARLRHDVDDGATGAAVLGRVGVVVDLELLYRVLRELVRRAAGAGAAEGLAEERVVIVRAIDDERVERAALSGEADVAGAHVLHHAGRRENEVDEVASIDRQVLNRCLVHDRAHLCALRFDERSSGRDGHRLGDADFHREVDRRVAADVDDDFLADNRLESFQRRFDAVRAGHQEANLIGADAVRHCAARDARGGVRRSHGDTGKCRAGVIVHRAGDGAGAALRKCAAGNQ